MPFTTGDQQYINDIITAINAYATAMNTFTAGAAATAQAALATALTNATNTHNATVNRQGE